MKLYKRSYVKAKKVMVDDYIKIGGLLFRARQVLRYEDDVEITAYNVGAKTRQHAVLILPKNTIVKIWNQA